MIRSILLAGVVVALGTGAGMAATEITWWHAMGGANGDELNKIVDQFNKSQTDYHVTAVFKGTYPETMTGAIAAFRAHQQPAIVQVFEVGTETMMAAKGAIYPIFQLMKDQGQSFDPKAYLPAVTSYYSDTDGNMLSFPFNSSSAVMYYNKDAFKKAGLDPEKPPVSWADVESDSKKLLSSGATKCGFTSGYAATWIGLEQFSAIQDVPFGTLQNGFGGLDTKFSFNGPIQVQHFEDFKKWQDEGVFKYPGPESGTDDKPLFYSQTCGILLESSAARADILKNTKFDVGVAPLPYYPTGGNVPMNSIIGGASLWVLQGQSPDVYKGVAAFMTYLSKPEVQAEWSQFTGYLPITTAAYQLGQQQGYYQKNPGSDVAIKQMTRKTPDANSKGIRFGNMAQVRDVIDDEFEQMLAGKKTAKQALDEAVTRGNGILRAFQGANQ